MNCIKKNITSSLIESYRKTGGINKNSKNNNSLEDLPSKRKIYSSCEKLLQVLFPGYHDQDPIPDYKLKSITKKRISILIEILEKEISKTIKLRSDNSSNLDLNYSSQSNKLACQFLSHLPKIRSILKTDVKAAYEGDPAATNYDEIILAYPSIEAIAIQRCAHCLYNLDVPLIPRIMTEYAHSQTGIDIHPGASIGTHFFIDHGTGVVIGETCEIGNHVKLYHGVTLGARNFPKDDKGRIVKGNKRHPNVGNNVVIYPNATILGGQTNIGDFSTIGANVFIQESISNYSFVKNLGSEIEIIDKKEDH